MTAETANNLFREQVTERRRQRLYGDVVLSDSRISSRLVVGIAAISLSLIVWATTATYPRTEAVPGVVMTSQPSAKVFAIRNGVAERVFVRDGSAVRRGQPLVFIGVDMRDEDTRGAARDSLTALTGQTDSVKAQMQAAHDALSSEREKLSASLETNAGEQATLREQSVIQAAIIRSKEEEIRRITPVADPKHSHEWGHLHFVVSPSQAEIHDYEVRVSEKPITASDPSSFTQGRQANVAALEDGMLVVPPGGAPGTSVDGDFGHLSPDTTYFVAIRAKNTCAEVSDYAIGSFTTTRVNFTKLSGCFVATAAFGSAMEPQVESLRQARDALRTRSEVFAAATDLYYRSGPVAASIISRSDSLRALARTLLGPIVAAAQTASPLTDPARAPALQGIRASEASESSPGRRGFAAPASR